MEELQKKVEKLLTEVFDSNKPEEDRLNEFKSILHGEDIKKMEDLYKQELEELNNVTTQNVVNKIEPKSFLNRSRLQKLLAGMLEDIAKYDAYLIPFIERFEAYNERIEAKYLPKSDTNQHRHKATIQGLDAPLHCAVRQLNEEFLDWLLDHGEVKINLRNKNKDTPLAMLCVMFDWHKQLEIFFKKTEKEKKQAESKTPYEKKQKKVLTKLHKEDEKMQAQKIDLKTGATTILRFVSKLLEKGADFNIYMNDWALPFDLLWKYYETETDVAEFINYYCKPNVAMTTLSVEGKVKSNKRSVEFHKKTEDRDVCVTVELLEIFICFNDSKNFTNFWERFAVTSENVEKVITLLLHVAVERNYTTYVDLIMKKASREIFKIEGNKSKTLDVQENCAVTLEKTPTSAEKPPGCCCLKKNCSNKTNSLAKGTAPNTQNEVLKMQDITPESKETRAATLERTSLSAEGSTSCWCCFKCCEKRHNPAVQEAHDPCAQKKKSRKHEDSRAKEEKLVHRFVLKGLLKKICLNGNLYLLKLFLDKVSDRFLLNEHPLLILTIQKMSKLKETQEFKYLHDCAKMLIENHCKIRMQDTDPNKNTALHLALSCGYDKLASLMLKEGHGLMGFRNRQNLTPIEYGTTEFWNNYLNNCITNKDGSELRFNVGFLKPLAKDESSNTSKSLSSKWYPRCIKLVEEMNETHNSKYRFTRTVNDMTALRLISQSTDRKEFLMHPVIIAFITMKWKRLCHWNVLNLLLTTITMFTFAGYTLLSPGTLKDGTMGFAIVGALILLVREIMQWWLLRWSYLTLENVVDIINLVFIGIVIVCGWEQGGVCEKVSIYSSFVVISLSLQASFLLGASWNNLSKTLYMFKTVSSSFFSSFLSFTPVLGAFIYSFYRTNNELLDDSSRYCFENNCSEENFNNFRSFWNATIKTLVMTTGEFEAANVNFESGKWLLFIGFLFIAPIVILNLINGLAVSDIAAIRQESEFISVCKKVRLLERYERAVVDSRSTMPEYLQRLFRDPWFPGSFFEKYESIIYVKVNEMNKLAIKTKKQEKSTKESSKNKASNENLVSNGTTCNVTPVCNDKEDMGTRQPESKIDRSTFNNNDTGNKKGDVSTPVDKNITPNNNDAMKRASRAGNDLQPIPGFPWLPSCSLRYYIGIRSFQLALYMSLDQSYVDMAKAIARSQLKNNSGRGSNELADTEQTERPALVNKTLMTQNKTSSLSRSAARSSKTNSRDEQIEKLQGQIQNLMQILNDMQQQLAGKHVTTAEPTASTSKINQ